ncbi:MAG TPA: GTP cyclohydrolase I FolE [Proteobacteria bacterium]|nr:GTP cyclohydrolase I FolE [Pseudomonadota bacterium]
MDQEKIKQAIRDLLVGIGEDPDRPGLVRTPERIAEMCGEILGGIGQDISAQVKTFPCPGFDEIVLIKDISFYSLCEHHLLPFMGKVHIAYIPKDSIITGLSNLVRIVDLFSRRLQLQERMTTEIADLLMKKLDPRGVLVQIEAEHLCMNMQGVKKPGTIVKTEAVRGNFRSDERTRSEALSLLKST